MLGLRQKCFSLHLITSRSGKLSQSHSAPQGLGSASQEGGQEGGLGQQHWLKQRISLSKLLLGFCPRSAPFVGSQMGTQPLQSCSPWDQAFAVGYNRVDYDRLRFKHCFHFPNFYKASLLSLPAGLSKKHYSALLREKKIYPFFKTKNIFRIALIARVNIDEVSCNYRAWFLSTSHCRFNQRQPKFFIES